MLPPKLRKTNRIKPKYNPTPTAQEKAYHVSLIGRLCFCGCGEMSDCVHHPLARHPRQRWRRDHEFVVPMTDHCHRALHAMGSEAMFDPDHDYPEGAYLLRLEAVGDGRLGARDA